MKLVVAEKPSAAQSFAKVLGANNRKEGWWEGNGYLVSWCVGHLVELTPPEGYNEKYRKWRKEDLPIIPSQWLYQISPATRKQFQILKRLMERKDVDSLICATDAGREGELIFRLVYRKCGCQKPFERLWVSSMEDSAIRAGFQNLKPSKEYDALYEAALCRAQADWLVGMNGTRLFSCLYGQTLNVGRVMTPTLAMVVAREAEIGAFKSEPFYTVELVLPGFTAVSQRMKDKAEAAAVCKNCAGETVTVKKVEHKDKSEKPPALYDLTTLQRDANRLLGYTAQQTLDYLQNLYEKKLCTYPRTDSRYLTSDMAEGLPELVHLTANALSDCKEITVSCNTDAVINDRKVTDHHAVIPTRELQKCNFEALPKGEFAILQLVCTRLLCAVDTPCLWTETEATLDKDGVPFTAKGRQILQTGWKQFLPSTESKPDPALPNLAIGEQYAVQGSRVKEGKTTPPKHFTEDTLLHAMETAGKDNMPEDAERKGLGTPATRAGTIEKLVRIGFLERKVGKKARHLLPTQKGAALAEAMPEILRSPAMTAEWEYQLLEIENRRCRPEDFMAGICWILQDLAKTEKGERPHGRKKNH